MFSNGPTIVTNGLVLALDAGDRNSYVSGSTTWFDLARTNNGTLTNGPTFNTGSGGSIVFDGVDDYVQFFNRITATDFQYYDTFTIECFAKIEENTNYGFLATNRAFSDGNGTLYTGWGFAQSSGRLIASVGGYPGSVLDWRFVNTSYSDFNDKVYNKWAHLVYTNDGTQGGAKIYINGENATSQSSDDNTPPYTINYNGNHKVTVGMSPADGSPGSHYLNGKITSTRIYNKTLSQQEILQNYNATKGRFGL
jgi:hypothetical protein